MIDKDKLSKFDRANLKELENSAYFLSTSLVGRKGACDRFRNRVMVANSSVRKQRLDRYDEFVDGILIYLEQKGRCYLCGSPMFMDAPSKDNVVSFTHLTPHSKGGFWSPSNIVLAHWRCNKIMSNYDLNEWAETALAILTHHSMIPSPQEGQESVSPPKKKTRRALVEKEVDFIKEHVGWPIAKLAETLEISPSAVIQVVQEVKRARKPKKELQTES